MSRDEDNIFNVIKIQHLLTNESLSLSSER